MIRSSRCPAIVTATGLRSPDIPVEELAHRWRAHQVLECRRRHIAELIVTAFDADDQTALRLVVADALNETAAVDVAALERAEIDGAAVPDVNRFGAELRGEPEQEEGCRCPDHAACAWRCFRSRMPQTTRSVPFGKARGPTLGKYGVT